MGAMKHVLVTGANGFIGSHLTDRLVREGVGVRCLVRRTGNLQWLKHPGIEIVQGELSDPESLRRAADGMDSIVHLAGKTKAATREEYFRANAEGTENLLGAADRNLERFVYVSTQAAAGPSPGLKPVRETDEPHPVTPYGESKLAGEKAVLARAGNMPVTVIRPPSVFGPRDKDMFQLFRAVHNRIRPMLGWKERFVSLVFIDDLVEGIWMALTKKEALGRTFFINTEDAVSWDDFGGTAARAMGRTAVPVRIPLSVFILIIRLNDLRCRWTGKASILNGSKIPEFRARYWITDGSRARNELGFRPKCPLSEAVRKTVDWYRREGWLPRG
jgi:nucleoside-diphosphate-sugar epimerase